MAYATLADLEIYLGETPPPAGSSRLLARASDLIDVYLLGTTYNNVNGAAIDASVITALNQATCAQVEWWIQTGDEFGDLARTTQYTVEGITVSQKPQGRLAPRAYDILLLAQLLPGVVRVN